MTDEEIRREYQYGYEAASKRGALNWQARLAGLRAIEAAAAKEVRLSVAAKVEALHQALCARLGNAHPITFEAETLLAELRAAAPAPVVAGPGPAEADLASVHEQLEGALAAPAHRPTADGWAYGGEGVGDG